MKKLGLIFILFVLIQSVFAQKTEREVFWSENFSGEKLPEGWSVVAENDSNAVWICTDQPFPGSHQLNRQAPPIASKSGGYHLQFRPGVVVDKNINAWNDKGIYPDAYVQTSAINCANRPSVFLKFQQNFRWNGWGSSKEAGLYVEVSSNGKDWTKFDVRNKIKAWKDCPNPMEVELNISKEAANKPTVYLRFHWKGLYAWYWMIDDIELTLGHDYDIGVVDISSHKKTNNTFKKSEVISLTINNYGVKDIKENFLVAYKLNDKDSVTITVPASKKKPFLSNTKMEVKFPAIDLTTSAMHDFTFYAIFPKDQEKGNNKYNTKLYAAPVSVGNITDFKKQGDTIIISSKPSKVKVYFVKEDIVRILLAPGGKFTNPAGDFIAINTDFGKTKITTTETNDYYKIESEKCVLRAYKKPLRFAMYEKDNSTLIWEEKEPLTYGYETWQSLKRGKDEQFYGCGMQNGYFSHRDKKVLIEIGGGWDNGGRPNPAPFYMSTAGYGAFRNTFDKGVYDFKETVKLQHTENRFDCYYFYGKNLKQILNLYTQLTGRPFMPPIWGLEMGDANCYNRKRRGEMETTPDVIRKVADKYRENDMPGGWILPNDGYGCGYVKLDSTVTELHKRGFYTGLWTQYGVENIAKEVGTFGSRLCKLDVAWVWRGYRFALDACRQAYTGIENNSNERGFVWSVMGWAGTQRYSVVWSGDQTSSWEYIRFHIPTVIGSGLSAQNCATGDIDAIFGGSAKTYTRDLQWKCFTPAMMVMSGWAKKDKQPWIYGEPYTSINRKYLKLKMRLTPYLYTYSAIAHRSGVPTVRAMVLEYPEDKITRDTTTQYQFMAGEWFLVAPVWKDKEVRNNIYLPKGKWFDYWTGKEYEGGRMLNNHSAPLEHLPLFVREGAIIPMYPEMLFGNEKPKNPISWDIYPSGRTEFKLYEDDGLSRKYKKGEFTEQIVSCEGDNSGTKDIKIKVGESKGQFDGKLKSRINIFEIHTKAAPKNVYVATKKLKKAKTKEKFETAVSGWYFDATDRNGILHIKTKSISTDKKFEVEIKYQ